jgi:hypothetical protein
MCPKDVRKVSLCLKRIGARVKVRVRSPKVTKSRIFKIAFRYRVTHVLGVVLDVEYDGGKHFEIWPPQNSEKAKKGGRKFEIFKIQNFEFKTFYLMQFHLRIPKMSFVLLYDPHKYQKFEFEKIKWYILLLFAPSSGQILSYGLEILHADSSHEARGQVVSVFWKTQNFGKKSTFSQNLFFWHFGPLKLKILKIRDSHLVDNSISHRLISKKYKLLHYLLTYDESNVDLFWTKIWKWWRHSDVIFSKTSENFSLKFWHNTAR